MLAVFNTLDLNGDGTIDLNELKAKYNASKHPAVIEGRKTEKQILEEFASTFELHASNCGKGTVDANITRQEFVEYYTNISANIDNDEYFSLMMRNCWKITQEQIDSVKLPNSKAVSENEEVKSVSEAPSTPGSKIGRKSVTEEVPVMPMNEQEEQKVVPAAPEYADKETEEVVKRFRAAATARGIKGILGIERQFKVYTKGSLLELDDFKKTVEDFRLQISNRVTSFSLTNL